MIRLRGISENNKGVVREFTENKADKLVKIGNWKRQEEVRK